MADAERKLRDALRAIERVRRSLKATQAHSADYVWSQIGKAVSALKKIEAEIEDALKNMRNLE